MIAGLGDETIGSQWNPEGHQVRESVDLCWHQQRTGKRAPPSDRRVAKTAHRTDVDRVAPRLRRCVEGPESLPHNQRAIVQNTYQRDAGAGICGMYRNALNEPRHGERTEPALHELRDVESVAKRDRRRRVGQLTWSIAPP